MAAPGLPLAQPGASAAAPGWAAALAQAHAAWSALQATLALLTHRAAGSGLVAADAQAAALLAAGDALTDALQAGGARPALHIINLCGRQRMQVQRLAKEALLAVLLAEPARHAALAPLVQAVDEGLAALARSPLSSPEIRDALASAGQQWQRLCLGLRQAPDGGALLMLVRASDALQDSLDQLTGAYEHSLQVIMA